MSVDSSGSQANGNAWHNDISSDGRYVAYQSVATNLVPGDTNDKRDIFVHDRVTGATILVSVDSSGNQGDRDSQAPSLSGDGRYIAFGSDAANLVPNDTNGHRDAFVHDRLTGATLRASVGFMGQEGLGIFRGKTISGDGQFVVFSSWAPNLVPGDTNEAKDIFITTNPVTDVAVLSWAGKQGWYDGSDGVFPDAGVAGTRFHFRVTYRHPSGTEPTTAVCEIMRGRRVVRALLMRRSGSAPLGPGSETTYKARIRLKRASDFSYRFRFSDGNRWAVGPPAEWMLGPTVTPASTAPGGILAIAAVQTQLGAQLTLSLPTSAKVDARVLNLAGRPVKTICTAKDCEAGSNTLLWNAMSDDGLRVPNGIYVVSIEAWGVDGVRARTITRLRLFSD